MSAAALFGLAVLGLGIGAVGTLIGAGGGFILVPILALMAPHESPAVLTAVSLFVVFMNALSGSIAYARQRRIDYRSGLIFAAAGFPGALLGAWLTRSLDRRIFDPLVGTVLMLGAVMVFWKPGFVPRVTHPLHTRRLVEKDGTVHLYTPRVAIGAAVSAGVGLLSSLLGIGGGIIHVPVMAFALGFPTHVATATSHFVLAILACAAVIVHGFDGSLGLALPRAIPISVGVILGAQLGALASSRIEGRWILRGLAVALAIVGVRLLFWHR